MREIQKSAPQYWMYNTPKNELKKQEKMDVEMNMKMSPDKRAFAESNNGYGKNMVSGVD